MRSFFKQKGTNMNTIKERQEQHESFHTSKYRGLLVTIDDHGEFLISTIGNIDHEGAKELLQSCLDSIILDEETHSREH